MASVRFCLAERVCAVEHEHAVDIGVIEDFADVSDDGGPVVIGHVEAVFVHELVDAESGVLEAQPAKHVRDVRVPVDERSGGLVVDLLERAAGGDNGDAPHVRMVASEVGWAHANTPRQSGRGA